MLIWLAEVSGIPSATLRRAIVSAQKSNDYRTCCAVIRRIIPWSLVEQRLEQ
jgi:hypothetical protein